MKNPIKSVLSCALSLALCVCLLPASAFAVEAPAEPDAAGEQEQAINPSDEATPALAEADGLAKGGVTSLSVEATDDSGNAKVGEGAGATLVIQGDGDSDAGGTGSLVAENDSDTCHWSLTTNNDPVLDEDGNSTAEVGLTLIIKPKDGSSEGTLANWDIPGRDGKPQAPPWIGIDDGGYVNRITRAKIEPGVKALVTREMFRDCANLTKIEGLSNLNVSAVANMETTFGGCSSLTSLDLSGWNTGAAITMKQMFAQCNKLETIKGLSGDLSNWSTASVTDMSYMFENCESLTTADVSGFNTASVTDMTNMFADCKELSTIDVSKWSSSSLEKMPCMFYGCKLLGVLNFGENWTVANAKDMTAMFAYCTNLAFISGLDHWNTSKVSKMNAYSQAEKFVDGPDGKQIPVMACKGLFAGCRSLTDLSGIAKWNMNGITDLSCMFTSCESLTSLDISGWNTGNVTKMPYLFYGCGSLTELDFVNKETGYSWSTSLVTDMTSMFGYCTNLKTIHGLDNWVTNNVEKIYELAPAWDEDTGDIIPGKFSDNGLFTGCAALQNIDDLSKWQVNNMEDLSCMFAWCTSLSDISPVSGWTVGTDKLKNMFLDCPVAKMQFGEGWIGKLNAGNLGISPSSDVWEYDNGNGTKQLTTEQLFEGLNEGLYMNAALDSKLDIKNAAVKYGSDQPWTGKPVTTEITVTYDGTLLKEGTDYQVVYENNTNVGTAKATVKGIGKYAGEQSFTFRIYKFDFSGASVTAPSDQLWTGSAITPAIEVTYNGAALRQGTDYEVRYENNVNVGTAKVTVTGIGSYEGSQSLSFRIYKFDFSGVSVTAPSDQLWTGSPITPPLTVTYDGAALKEGTDYTVSYENNINVGIARGTVTGLGKYGGEQSFTFQIITNPDLCQVMYRAYNPNSGEHFYTASYDEVESIVAAGWRYEGEAWTAPVTSATPVYRLYSGTDHHYTTSVVERDHLMSVGWSDEGIGWYSDDNEGVGLHRLFNPNVDPSAPTNNSGSHHYTTSEVERDHLVSIGWQYEDFGWYGVK